MKKTALASTFLALTSYSAQAQTLILPDFSPEDWEWAYDRDGNIKDELLVPLLETRYGKSADGFTLYPPSGVGPRGRPSSHGVPLYTYLAYSENTITYIHIGEGWGENNRKVALTAAYVWSLLPRDLREISRVTNITVEHEVFEFNSSISRENARAGGSSAPIHHTFILGLGGLVQQLTSTSQLFACKTLNYAPEAYVPGSGRLSERDTKLPHVSSYDLNFLIGNIPFEYDHAYFMDNAGPISELTQDFEYSCAEYIADPKRFDSNKKIRGIYFNRLFRDLWGSVRQEQVPQ